MLRDAYREKAMWWDGKKVVICKPRREASAENKPLRPRSCLGFLHVIEKRKWIFWPTQHLFLFKIYIWLCRGAWWATVHGVTKSWTQLRTHIHIYYVLRLASLRITEILPRFLFQSLSEFIPHDRLKYKWHAYLPHVDHAYVRHF